jgi:hypothetical protein
VLPKNVRKENKSPKYTAIWTVCAINDNCDMHCSRKLMTAFIRVLTAARTKVHLNGGFLAAKIAAKK